MVKRKIALNYFKILTKLKLIYVYHVTQVYVPYVQVQHRQLGVTRLLGVKLLSVHATVIYISVTKLAWSDAPFWQAHYCACTVLIHNRYSIVTTLCVPYE